jgi:Protein of unknown function (DUF3631)
MPKKTPAQHFAQLFALFTAGATEGERAAAERKMDAWLKRHAKTRADIASILVQAAADDAAAHPPPPPSDPRDDAPHPFDNPEFTPAGLVEGIAKKYVTMSWYASVVYSLWICFTHVYRRFTIAPRVALTSEEPDSGKTTGLEVARRLVFKPNPETLGTGAAIAEFLSEGPCTVLLDELDHVDAEARRRLLQIWNLGHRRGATISLQVGGRRKLINVHAPMLAAGVGSFLGQQQQSRTFTLEMKPYTAETKPEREYDDDEVGDLDAVYSYLRHWAAKAKLNPKPAMPPGVIRRYADNMRGLLSVADSCGSEWGQRAREALTFLLEKEKSVRPQITMVRHGLMIFDTLEPDQIGSVRFNRELKRLDLPDANWTRYRGPSGNDYAHPITMAEQSALLEKVGIHSTRVRPPGEKQCRGYKLAQFQEAQRKYGVVVPDDVEPGRARLRLITPSSD